MEKNWGSINGSAIIKGAEVKRSKRSGMNFLTVELQVDSEIASGKMWGHLPLEGLGAYRFLEFVRAVGFANSEMPGVVNAWRDGVEIGVDRLYKVLVGRVVGVYVSSIEFEGNTYLNIRRFRTNGWIYSPYEGYTIIVPEWWSKEGVK